MRHLSGRHLALALLLLAPYRLSAQVKETPQDSSTTPKKADDPGIYSGTDVFIPKDAPKNEPETPARSFSDGFLRDGRQHVGGSIALSQSYTPNLGLPDTGKTSLDMTSIAPQAYVNFHKKKLEFRLNYGFTYQRWTEGGVVSSSPLQNGSASLSYNASHKKTTLQILNSVNSAYYNQGSMLGLYLTTPLAYGANFNAAQTYPNNQRVSQAVTGATVTYSATKKTSFSTGINYTVVEYRGANSVRTNWLAGTVGASFRLNKWVFFNTNYTQNLYGTNYGQNTANTQHLQVGGLSFQPGRGWMLSASGGLDSTKANGARQLLASVQGGISKSSHRTTVGISYNRGFTQLFPTNTVWSADTATANIVYHLTSRVTVRSNASYMRGSTFISAGNAHSQYGAVGIDFLPQNNLVFSTNYFLVSQKINDPSFQQPELRRSTVSAAVTYYLPSIHRERN
jgi:hypothetical protein